MSEFIENPLNEIKGSDAYMAVSDENSRMYLESLRTTDMNGFDPTITAPQTTFITSDITLTPYGRKYQILATITLSAPTPNDWTKDTSFAELQRFAQSDHFDIEVANVKIAYPDQPLFEPDIGTRLPAKIDLIGIGEIIKTKLEGGLPSVTGFNDTLTHDIHFIMRRELSDYLIKTVGKWPLSTATTTDILFGNGLPVQVKTHYCSYYKLLTTKNNTPAHLDTAFNYRIYYGEDYYLDVLVVHELAYPSGEAPYIKPRHIKKYLENAVFKNTVVSVDLNRNPDATIPMSDEVYLDRALRFDENMARRLLGQALSKPAQTDNESLLKIASLIEAAGRQSIGSRMVYGGDVRIDLG